MEPSILRRQYQGSALGTSASLSQLVATLVPTLVLAAIYLVLFLLLRPRLKHFYAPRSHVGSLLPREQSPDLPHGLFDWIGAFFKTPDSYVLDHHSLDGFLLLRYLKISVIMCVVGCLLIWPILFPVNATGGGVGSELDLLSFSNVLKTRRFYAHTLVAWVYFSFIFYMVMRESIYYINLRQAYLVSPLYAQRVSQKTVLFASVPREYQKETKIRQLLGPKVKYLWINSDCKELEKLVKERDGLAMKLETAETKLVKMAVKSHRHSLKKEGHLNNTRAAEKDAEGASGSLASHWVRWKKRPSHRIGLLGLLGRKVDSIDWCRSELQRLVAQIEATQAKFRSGEGASTCSAFVEFYSQADAQAAYQGLTHHQPLHMSPRFIGIDPDEVIWENMSMTWYMRVVVNIVTSGLITALIIFWAIPVSFVGILSNISSLTQTTPGHKALLPWLGFINKMPGFILGVVQGLLPSVLLSLLMAILPIILRSSARLAGMPSRSNVELRVQNTYFLFQVIQVFLITTVSSSASAAGVQIAQNPTSVTTLLSSDLPKASNFYISYFILQGLTISSGQILQIFSLILSKLCGTLLDSTPRKKYKRYATLSDLGWGTEFPVYTLLTVIALTYSIIAPLVLGFGAVGLYLIYLAYRYNLLFVFSATIDTKGLVYPRALQQTTTGIYLATICLIGLFAVAKAFGPLILMIIYLILVTLFHISLNAAIDPLLESLPQSLQTEEEALLTLEKGQEYTDPQDSRHPDSKTTIFSEDERFPRIASSPNAAHRSAPPPNFLTRFLFPHKHSDYHTLRHRIPRISRVESTQSPEKERDAYHHPAISSPTPILWIPRDGLGVSTQEVAHCREMGILISDEMAGFDEKGRMVWDVNGEGAGNVPVRREKRGG